jgi:hypothetical protein
MPERTPFRTLAAGGALLTLAAWAVFWWLAVPRHDICPMIRPAPAGCFSGRVPVAASWTVITGCLYGAMLLLATRRFRRRWWFLALAGLVASVAWGYWAVLFA